MCNTLNPNGRNAKMRRHNVNKRHSAKKFNHQAKKTARANLMVARGGYRL